MMARITPLLVALLLSVTSLFAAAPEANAINPGISDRMRERLPMVDSLKAEGRVGENNLGFLAVRGVLSTSENSVVAAENADRVDEISVGKARAEQIAQRSADGVWLQDPAGRWYRK